MFIISTIHQQTSVNPNRRSRRSLTLRTVRDMPLHACAWTSTFKQLRTFVQSKRFSSFGRELSHNSQWSKPYNKVQNFNKCFNFFSRKKIFRAPICKAHCAVIFAIAQLSCPLSLRVSEILSLLFCIMPYHTSEIFYDIVRDYKNNRR